MPKRKISNKKAFEFWVTHGSLVKAAKAYEDETGKKMTPPGIQYARDVWIVKHPDEAKDYLLFVNFLEEDEWDEFYVKRMINVYRRNPDSKKFHRLIIKYNLLKYSHLYEDTFGKTFTTTRNTSSGFRSLQRKVYKVS